MDNKQYDINESIDWIDQACESEVRVMDAEKRRVTFYAQSEAENATLGGETLTSLPEEINHRYRTAKHALAVARRRAYDREFADRIQPELVKRALEIAELYGALAQKVDAHLDLHRQVDQVAGRCGADAPPRLFTADHEALTGGHFTLWRERAMRVLGLSQPAPAAAPKPKPLSIGELVKRALAV